MNRVSGEHKRRGIAMLLVLICLAIATVSAMAYVSSRDNSALIGENVATAAAARWAASSSLEMTVAVLETDWNWREEHAGGTLFSNLELLGAKVTVTATDLVNEQAPTDETTFIRVDATADIAGVTQTASAVVFVPPPTGDSVAVDLGEFAAFAAGQLELREQAFITRWPASPLSRLGTRVQIGTRATNASGVAVRDSAAAIDATAFTPPEASEYVLAVDSGPGVWRYELPDPVPFPSAPTLYGVEETASPAPPPVFIPSGRMTYPSSARARQMEVRGAGTVVLNGDVTLVVEQDLRLDGGTLEINGHATVIVFGDLRMENGGAILLNDGSTLTAFVKGRSGTGLEIRDSYVGNMPRETIAGGLGRAAWMDPRQVTFFSLADAADEWRIRGGSTFKGSLYAPDVAQLRVEESAGVYGRIACPNLAMRGDAGIYYCPILNGYNGYTNLNSDLYDEDGRLKEEFRLLSSLDPLVLEPIANTVRTVIRIGRNVLGTREKEPAEETGPNEPTPRINYVIYNPLAFGSDAYAWEDGM